MKKKEYVRKVTQFLRDHNCRKNVRTKKQVFSITDGNGKSADFTVRGEDKDVIYNIDDVEKVIDACLAVIEDAVKSGEEVSIHGYGTIGLKYLAPRRSKNPYKDEWYDIDGRFSPKVKFGTKILLAAKVYELALKDRGVDFSSADNIQTSLGDD